MRKTRQRGRKARGRKKGARQITPGVGLIGQRADSLPPESFRPPAEDAAIVEMRARRRTLQKGFKRSRLPFAAAASAFPPNAVL